ncbi:superoxide dismutase family protein [Parvularcula marina]|uniref:superoxide dismutase family protein n=1 Tax=Parvularcula marina TaxID=2292771 RepID=UPI0035159928
MFRMICLSAASFLAVSACGGGDEPKPVENAAEEAPQPEMAPEMASEEAPAEMEMAEEHHEHHEIPAPAAGEDMRVDFTGTDGEATGEAVVVSGPHGMLLRVDLVDLEHGFHGMHMHQVGDCSDFDGGFKLSGSHINPTGKEHGLMNPAGFELADIPNIYVHHNGHARAEIFVAGLTLEDAMDEDGFAIVVHENPDDHMTQPIGGAGARVACASFNVF